MNLLLHGLEYPEIESHNALDKPLREIGDRDRVDVIMTNPPFGGEEERGILSNFPEDKQTSETALLFLQLIMRRLRRPVGSAKPGRCGMVVPNGVLFGDGVCARIKKELLEEFNLHTIVRLPNGVFAALHQHPDQSAFLRPFGADQGNLVLRAAPARRPQELQQDSADAVRGICRLPEMVEGARGQ